MITITLPKWFAAIVAFTLALQAVDAAMRLFIMFGN